ncbi:MAG: M67 family metallopeptidase [Rhodospirillaceae bacterium]|jgi:proteasome lid subunit RPN8/RPN11|nr:M67 family metallopeptidase [Rhodospirillaceae bacterium]
MLLLKREDLKQIADQAEAAYPLEACGLLAGFHSADGDIVVTQVAPSKNVAEPAQNDRFEIDPEMRLSLMRELRAGAPKALKGAGRSIIGHYHSHPDGTARPSATDLSMAWEPDLVWLITAVVDGQAVQSTAHLLSEGGTRFNDIGLDCLPGDEKHDEEL